MKKIIILYILCIISIMTHGQTCPDKHITTDPNNPFDERDMNYNTNMSLNLFQGQPRFNWLENEYTWFKELLPDCIIPNLHLQQTHNNNIDHLFHPNPIFRDNQIEDGWELIIYNFGKSREGVVDGTSAVSHPHFVVYNKYSGILRVFYYLMESNFNLDYDLVTLTLKFSDVHNRSDESYNLNFGFEAGKPLDYYDKEVQTSVPNIVWNGFNPNDQCLGMWLSADFVIAYDPCVCKNRYGRIEISVDLINKALVQLEGTITADLIHKPNVNSSGSTSNSGNADKSGFNLNNAIKETSSTMKGTIDLYDKLGNAKTKTSPILDTILNVAAGHAFDLAKTIPYVGAAIGLVNFLIKTSSKTPVKEQITTNAAAVSTIRLTGSIEESASAYSAFFEVPGSNYPPYDPNNPIITASKFIPMYDEPLGVISLLKTPAIEVDNYKPVVVYQGTNWGLSDPNLKVQKYTIKDDLELVLNPSSELILESATASIVLEYLKEPDGERKSHQMRLRGKLSFLPYIPGATIGYSPGPNNVYNIPYQGYSGTDWLKTRNTWISLEVANWEYHYKVSYGQMPISAIKDLSFYLWNQDDLHIKPKIVIRINAILYNPNTESRTVVVHSYLVDPVKININSGEKGMFNLEFDNSPGEEQYDWEGTNLSKMKMLPMVTNYFGGGANLYNSNWRNKPDFLYFGDENIAQGDYGAWQGIVFGDNAQIAPGSTFRAGEFIKINPDNVINPDVSMKIGFSHNSWYRPATDFLITDPTELLAFCKDRNPGEYNPEKSKKNKIPDNDTTPIVKSFDFKLYPNPTSRIVNVELPEMAEGGVYDITVMDIRGQVMSEMRILPSETIGSVYEMEVSHLTAGIYFVRLVIDGEAKVKRLVIL